MSDSRLVYSTDPRVNKQCPRCRELISECTCVAEGDGGKGYKFTAKLSLEKKGRNGKQVTVIRDLPKTKLFLSEWTTRLKKKCGSGGTYLMEGKDGVIEIQGDKRDLIRACFQSEGIKTKE